MTFVEVAAAIMLLGVLATVVTQCAAWTAGERRAAERREIALFEAANVMERLASEDWESLAPKAAAEDPLSTAAKEMLPGGRLTTEIQLIGDNPAAKRIVVEVQWLNRAGESESPVRLVTWRYQGRGTRDGGRGN
jgi:Tfp pilus assembly protein PilE